MLGCSRSWWLLLDSSKNYNEKKRQLASLKYKIHKQLHNYSNLNSLCIIIGLTLQLISRDKHSTSRENFQRPNGWSSKVINFFCDWRLFSSLFRSNERSSDHCYWKWALAMTKRRNKEVTNHSRWPHDAANSWSSSKSFHPSSPRFHFHLYSNLNKLCLFIQMLCLVRHH